MSINQYNNDMNDLPEIKLKVTKVKAKSRKLDIGNFPVCPQCGMNLIQWPPGSGPCDCGCTERISLREYVTEVRREPFNVKDWTWGEPEMVHVWGEGVEEELTNILAKEKENELRESEKCKESS